MRCSRCGQEYPSPFYFAVKDVCDDCFKGLLPQEQQELKAAEVPRKASGVRSTGEQGSQIRSNNTFGGYERGGAPTDSDCGGSNAAALGWGWFFLVVAMLLVGVGFYTMFTYDSIRGEGKIVGGDAYNYIIIATRGVGFISAGVVSALIGVGAILSGILRRSG